MDLSWSELMVVAIVALIVIGPKDLPGMFRELGRFTAKIRAMGRDFNRAMEQAAKETGIKDVADDLRKVTSPKAMGLDAVRSAADKFEKWDPLKSATGTTVKSAPLTPPPMPATPAAAPVIASVAATAAPGTATAALAEQVAAKKVASADAAAKLRSAKAGATKATATAEAPASAATPEAPAPKRGGRVRKKAETTPGDAA
ncbi:MAG: Sec-independent protein translocase protein TatB [Rhodobacterales bacterium]|nr:Sec-independent protein translocase protein TatB [Rhodobacterales bacterium]